MHILKKVVDGHCSQLLHPTRVEVVSQRDIKYTPPMFENYIALSFLLKQLPRYPVWVLLHVQFPRGATVVPLARKQGLSGNIFTLIMLSNT